MSGDTWTAERAEKMAARATERRAELREQFRTFVDLRGDERALDAGTGTGALALALAPLVREVIGVDRSPELLAEARRQSQGVANVSFVEGDITKLAFDDGAFDLACCARTLHHVPRPERVFAELTRVLRPGGRLVVIDQIAPADPLIGLELDRFERARDPSHARLLADVDIRTMFEANGLVVRRERTEREQRDLERHLDLAGCEGEGRERARGLAPPGYTATIAWYLAARPVPRS